MSRQPCNEQPFQARLISDGNKLILNHIAYPQPLDFVSFLVSFFLLAGTFSFAKCF